MLAVVFWHRRKFRSRREHYVEALVDFHESLKALKPTQFRFSATFETPGVPWLKADTETFEDWYILSKFAGMDSLDEAIKSIKAHQRLMKIVGGAKGGFYGLSDGQPRVSRLLYANWYTKTARYSNDELIISLCPDSAKSQYSIWARAMGAGPKQNCILSAKPITIPVSLNPFSQTRKLIWSGI